jgi:ribosomal protein S9
MISKKIVEFRGTGHRKCAIARVTINEGAGKFEINGKTVAEFCPLDNAERKILTPLVSINKIGKIDITIKPQMVE